MIRLDNIGKQHGQQILFVEASAQLNRGEKVGLVGPNGAGKSTLFRMVMQQEHPDEGQVSVDKGVTVGYLPQEPELDPALDVRGNVMEGVAAKRALLDRYNEVAMQVAEDYSDALME